MCPKKQVGTFTLSTFITVLQIVCIIIHAKIQFEPYTCIIIIIIIIEHTDGVCLVLFNKIINLQHLKGLELSTKIYS